MILTADIGGTNARFTCFSRVEGVWKNIFSGRYQSGNYSSLYETVKYFLDDCAFNGKFEASCFSLAGPVTDGNCELVNLGWKENEDLLKAAIPELGKVFFINDISAAGYGILGMDEDDFVSVTPGLKGKETGNKAVIAPGTGLGEGVIIGNKPIGSEGGHSDFAARNEREIKLLRFLQRNSRHVSYEKVLSGGGLLKIAAFLAEERGIVLNQVTPEEVSRAAFAGGSDVCEEAMEMYVEILGAEVGNMALRFLAEGGVYIAGGVAPAILPELQKPHFMGAVRDKGRFRKFLEGIPVYVIVNDGIQMQGCLNYLMMIL
ncbi:MAG: glucokinase [Lentihominibacter sp.]|jgi:glucokinase